MIRGVYTRMQWHKYNEFDIALSGHRLDRNRWFTNYHHCPYYNGHVVIYHTFKQTHAMCIMYIMYMYIVDA